MNRSICIAMGKLIPLLALSALVCSPLNAQVPYVVTIDTSALNGTTGGVAFDFISGDGMTLNNMVSITSFSTDATLIGAANTVQGSATGDLPSDLTLNDTGFTESFRGLTFGNSLSYTFTTTSNQSAPGVDEFSFFLTNAANTGTAISTSDPTGSDALFAFDIDGSPAGAMTVFSSSTPGVSFTVAPAAASNVPEPSAYQFIALGLASVGLALGWNNLRRKRKIALP